MPIHRFVMLWSRFNFKGDDMAFTNGKRQRTELPSIVDDIILSHYFFEVTYCSGHCSKTGKNWHRLDIFIYLSGGTNIQTWPVPTYVSLIFALSILIEP